MTQKRVDVFFYGLFMDPDVLHEYQVSTTHARHGFVDDYTLRIGQRATLVSQAGARVYGMIYALTDNELKALYDLPGLECYQPESLTACTLSGNVVSARCYMLPEISGYDEVNQAYADKLRHVLDKLDFPSEYIATLR